MSELNEPSERGVDITCTNGVFVRLSVSGGKKVKKFRSVSSVSICINEYLQVDCLVAAWRGVARVGICHCMLDALSLTSTSIHILSEDEKKNKTAL